MPEPLLVRQTINISREENEWVTNNFRRLGFGTKAKLMRYALQEFIRTKTEPAGGNQEEKPKTPEEEFNLTVEKMGVLEMENHDRFEAIRELTPSDVKRPEKDSDLKPLLDAIWKAVAEKNGSVQTSRKVVAITRSDLAKYEELGKLSFRKKALEAEMTSTVSS